METRTNIRYKIHSIAENCCILNIDKINVSDINEESLRFQYKIETLIKMSENIILVTPSIRFILGDTTILEVSATISYDVQTLDEAFSVDKENHKINIKADILPSFVGASYSTLGGIVYAKTVGTPLAQYPIPMIEITTLMNKNAISVED